MKIYKYILLLLSGALAFNSCSDDKESLGNPTFEPKTEFKSAMFADSLEFSVDVADQDVPLSTLKARLYYSEELVSETVIRTKTNGNYEGKIYVPFYANVPNGKATLKLVLQNTSLTITEKSYEVALTRPDFPYLTLVVGEEGHRMERKGLYQYEVKKIFPIKLKGYIVAPAVGESGNEITFGWEENKIEEHSTTEIPFSNSEAGEYAINFNTLTYEADPFIVNYAINGTKLERIDDDNYKIDLDLTKDQEIVFEEFENFDKWWVDPDFFTLDKGKYAFKALDGKYRITASLDKQYFRVEPLDTDGKLAILNADGSGAIWAIGNNIGKPSVKANQTGWTVEKGLALVYLGNKKHEISLVADQTISADKLDFKFFHQRGWGGEFKSATLTTKSSIVSIGVGDKDLPGDGNIFLPEGTTLKAGKTYVFTIDLTEGNDKAVLTVTEK